MGEIEERTRKRARKQNIQRAILGSVAVVGVIAWIALAPNTLQLLKYAPGMRARYNSRISRSRSRLIAEGSLEVTMHNGIRSISITRRGQATLARMTIAEMRTEKKRRWDKRWRIVIFDIAEKYKSTRDHLRSMLLSIGFKKLQNSVWVYPYDCEDLITLLKVDSFLGKQVLYIVAEEIEQDAALRRHFNLPLAN